MALPVLGHQQPLEVRVAVEDDPHQVELLALVPVAGRPDRDDARDALALVGPALEARAWRSLAQREEVVADREALRLELGQHLEPLCHRMHEVAAARGADVAGDALAAPAEVVGRDDVDAHVEAELVARVLAGLADPLLLDRHRRHLGPLAVRDVAGNPRPVGHVATPTRSYAGGTPAWCASCRRMIPSISASGRGGQKGT